MATAALLELDKLEVAYGGIHAVKGIDLIVRQGELVCLIGANGAGKTTLLDCVSGFLDIDRGRVQLRGHDVIGQLGHVQQIPREIVARGFVERRVAEPDGAPDAVPVVATGGRHVVVPA